MFANANRASGKENSDTDSYTETHITTGQTLTAKRRAQRNPLWCAGPLAI